MFDIRRVCNGDPSVHSRYMADVNGCIYSSYGPNCFRVVNKDGVRVSIMGKKKKLLQKMEDDNLTILYIEDSDSYYLMNDGSVLKRLSTRYIKEKNRVDVSINRIYGRDKGDRMFVHRAVAAAFHGCIADMEVHHIDKNPMNNRVDNLAILTREEHLKFHEAEVMKNG